MPARLVHIQRVLVLGFLSNPLEKLHETTFSVDWTRELLLRQSALPIDKEGHFFDADLGGKKLVAHPLTPRAQDCGTPFLIIWRLMQTLWWSLQGLELVRNAI